MSRLNCVVLPLHRGSHLGHVSCLGCGLPILSPALCVMPPAAHTVCCTTCLLHHVVTLQAAPVLRVAPMLCHVMPVLWVTHSVTCTMYCTSCCLDHVSCRSPPMQFFAPCVAPLH